MRFVYLLLDLNTINTFVFLYRYTFYADLKDTFGERVWMLYTDTDSFLLHFFVEYMAKAINARHHHWGVFDLSE